MVYLLWSERDPPAGLGEGPWREVFVLGPGLALVDSDASRSRLYHAAKETLPRGTALLVAALDEPPKFKGLASGAGAWLRART